MRYESYHKLSISMPRETHQKLLDIIDWERGDSVSAFISWLIEEFYERHQAAALKEEPQ